MGNDSPRTVRKKKAKYLGINIDDFSKSKTKIKEQQKKEQLTKEQRKAEKAKRRAAVVASRTNTTKD